MMKNCKLTRGYLNGSTLVELLIVIIVSGIIFLALFDGMDIARRYSSRVINNISNNNEFQDGFQQLDYFFQISDSVCLRGNNLHFFVDNYQRAEVVRNDSLLLYKRDETYDTLFKTLYKFDVKKINDDYEKVDSLFIGIVYRKRFLDIPFGLIEKPDKKRALTIEEKENKYLEMYESRK